MDFTPLQIKRLIEIGDAEGVGGLHLVVPFTGFEIRDVIPILTQTGVV